MKFLSIVLSFLVLFSLSVPVFAASGSTDPSDLNDSIEIVAVDDVPLSSYMASWEVVCNLGTIHLYAANGVDSTGIVIIDESIVNLTNNTVYFYSPEYPDYTFSASRFSPIYYRADNYNSSILNISSVEQVSVNYEDYYGSVLCFILIAIFLIIAWGVLFK